MGFRFLRWIRLGSVPAAGRNGIGFTDMCDAVVTFAGVTCCDAAAAAAAATAAAVFISGIGCTTGAA